MKRLSAAIAGAFLLGPVPVTAQLTPPSTGGVIELDRLLQQIAQPRRVLVIAAHPDDEDTGLLARVALGDGARAAYMSLSRGEGGQNLIGPELGAQLGLLRTRELQAARAIDGAEQFFSRAFDFGYTRSLDETATKWPLDSLLKDAIRVVRRFRPHIMVSTFSGTPRDGHGQHQAAGVTARQAFELAGDPTVFPELALEEGLMPWTPSKLYRSTRFDQSATNVTVSTGDLDGRTGRSFHQIAMDSRSQHRSQDMGMIQETGPRRSTMRMLVNRTEAADTAGFFSGVELDQGVLGRLADSLRGELSPNRMHDLVPALSQALEAHRGAEQAPLLERAIAVAAGVVFDVVSDQDALVMGQEFQVTGRIYNGGQSQVRASWSFGLRANITPRTPVDSLNSPGSFVEPGQYVEFVAPFRVDETDPTQPYFVVNQHNGMMYDWAGTPIEYWGLPFQPPVMEGFADLEIDGTRITISREVTRRIRDQAFGERRRALRVVPLVDVKIDPSQLVWPVDQFPQRTFTATLTYNGNRPYSGMVAVSAEGWPVASPSAFSFERLGESRQFEFAVAPPHGVVNTTATVKAVAVGDDGQEFGVGVYTIDYPHIRPAHWVEPAEARIVLSSLVAPPMANIGYVRGAADRIPEALEQVGVSVELLEPADLRGADLSRFDVIIVGPRAYETTDALRRHNDRLLEYSRNGGHLVVQYQQYQFVQGNFTPYPLTIGRPHDRVTDETAPMTILVPDHPVFRGPNRIEAADWEGWPQERGLYFAQTWDDAYQPLIESQDPGRDPVRGAMLYAEYGAGTYVYTGISFFRALPGGNPGAFKLFLNLIGARRSDVP